MAALAALLLAAFAPASAAACCEASAATVEAACGACCQAGTVCAPRSSDEATAAKAFSLATPSAPATVTGAARGLREGAALSLAPRTRPAAEPPHLSHIPLLV
jgi:hypothetical protein